MKHLDNFLAVFAFGLCTITLATFFAATAGWAYGALGDHEREIVALAGNPLLGGLVTAVTGPRASADDETAHAGRSGRPVATVVTDAQVVHLEPVTVAGHRSEGNTQSSHVAQAVANPSPNATRGKS